MNAVHLIKQLTEHRGTMQQLPITIQNIGLCTLSDVNHCFVSHQDLKADPKDEFLSALRAIIKSITSSEKYFKKIIRLAINKME